MRPEAILKKAKLYTEKTACSVVAAGKGEGQFGQTVNPPAAELRLQ
ncbi:MAG: hypothetical protein QM771_20310 [Nitrospira sp.]